LSATWRTTTTGSRRRRPGSLRRRVRVGSAVLCAAVELAFAAGAFPSSGDSVFFLRRRPDVSGSAACFVWVFAAGLRARDVAGAASSPAASLVDALRRRRPGLASSADSEPDCVSGFFRVAFSAAGSPAVSEVASSPPAAVRVVLPRPRPPRRRRRRRGAVPPSPAGPVSVSPAVSAPPVLVAVAALAPDAARSRRSGGVSLEPASASADAGFRGERLRVRVPPAADDPERLRVVEPVDGDAPFSPGGCVPSSPDGWVAAPDGAPCASPFEPSGRPVPLRPRPRPPRRRRRRRGADSGAAEPPSDPGATSAAAGAAGEAACSVPASLTKLPFRSGHAHRGEGPAARRGDRKDRRGHAPWGYDRARSRERSPIRVLTHGNLVSPSGPAVGAPAPFRRGQPAAAWRLTDFRRPVAGPPTRPRGGARSPLRIHGERDPAAEGLGGAPDLPNPDLPDPAPVRRSAEPGCSAGGRSR
jgi:hypothetical protein